jgi:hypothetical protein
MHDLIRTNDPVLISFVESLMRDAGIAFLVADSGMSILEGSVGVIPRRILVDPEMAVPGPPDCHRCGSGKRTQALGCP